jgi:hypothetical protein
MKPDFLKIRDNDHLIKNANTKAILNTDSKSLNKYREERDKLIKLSKVVEDTDKLKEDVAEIKNMLRQLLGNKQ